MSGRWLVILALLGASVYQFLFPGLVARGQVLDQATGRPVPGVTVVSSRGSAAVSDASGSAQLRLRPAEVVTFQAEGYLPARALYLPWQPLKVTLAPRPAPPSEPAAQPSAAAQAAPATGGASPQAPDSGGQAASAPAASAAPAASQAPAGAVARGPYDASDAAAAGDVPRLIGVVTDAATGRPVPGALVGMNGTAYLADDEGAFRLSGRPTGGTLWVLKPGYRRAEVDLTQQSGLEVKLQPFEARGLYLTFYGVANEELRENALKLLEPSGLNAVVIDVKGDRGFIAYPSAVPLATRIGANDEHTIQDVDTLLKRLKGQGIYTIARIVVFKDDRLARNGKDAGADVSVKNSQTGGPWIDGEGLGWVDPFQQQAWDYNVALAREAAEKGFDEVQFDYIRFPTDPASGSSVSVAQFSQALTEQNRVKAIATFLERARTAVNEAGAYLSVDTFGYTTWRDDDMGIGQNLPTIAERVDYISPMVYPSTYSAGLPGMTPYPDVVHKPHLVVYESMLRAHQRVDGRRALLRPWLQYFDDYPWATAMPYTDTEIAAQVRAARESGCVGFLLWDPTNKYRYGAVSEQK